MTFDTSAYYGQPTTMLPPFPPPGLYGGLPGLYGALAEQALAAQLGFSPTAGMRPRLSPFDIGSLPMTPPAPIAGLPWGGAGIHGQMIGSWPGQPQLGVQGPYGIPQSPYGQSPFGQLSGQSPFGQFPGQSPFGQLPWQSSFGQFPGMGGGWALSPFASPLLHGNPFASLYANPLFQQLHGNPFQHQLQGNPSQFPFGHQAGGALGRFQPYQAFAQAS